MNEANCSKACVPIERSNHVDIELEAVCNTWLLVVAALDGAAFSCSYRCVFIGQLTEGQETAWIDLPADRHGRVFEVIRAPINTSKVRIELSSVTGATLRSAGVRRIGPISRFVAMFGRVVSVAWRFDRNTARFQLWARNGFFGSLSENYRRAGQLLRWAPAPSYAEWRERFDDLSNCDLSKIRTDVAGWRRLPTFIIVVYQGSSGAAGVSRTLRSLGAQIYTHFEIIQVADRNDTKIVERLHDGEAPVENEWWLWISGGDLLPRHALYWYAWQIRSAPLLLAVYSDDDEVDLQGNRDNPRFKPDWSERYFQEEDYIGESLTIRRGLMSSITSTDTRKIVGFGARGVLAEVLLNRSLRAHEVAHIPAILRHCEVVHPSGMPDCAAERRSRPQPDCHPKVSIIIPTKNSCSLLRACIESLRSKSSYPDYEVILVDNASDDSATLNYLIELAEQPWIRVIRDESSFNYAEFNNNAARVATGEILVLLNNDTEVLSPDWLRVMVKELSTKDGDGNMGVGVVGPKLLFPNGSIQHAGIGIGISGCADHLHAWIDGSAPGYLGRASIPQEVSAVTGACLMTWKNLYLALGGLDGEHLKVAFNDVDYCLRVREAGRKVIFTPHAQLIHHESATRGQDMSDVARRRTRQEANYMRRRWKAQMQNDPFYNPNLNYARPDFSLSPVSRIDKPWIRDSRSWISVFGSTVSRVKADFIRVIRLQILGGPSASSRNKARASPMKSRKP